MKKWIVLVVMSLIMIVLTACGEKEQEKTTPATNDSYKRPPTLYLAVSDVLVERIDAQTYQWTYTDKETNETVQNATDALPPSKIVSMDDMYQVKDMKYLKVGFQPMPQFYRIMIWNRHDEQIAKYTDEAAIKENGAYILEVEAKFENGTAQYFVPIHLPKRQ